MFHLIYLFRKIVHIIHFKYYIMNIMGCNNDKQDSNCEKAKGHHFEHLFLL